MAKKLVLNAPAARPALSEVRLVNFIRQGDQIIMHTESVFADGTTRALSPTYVAVADLPADMEAVLEAVESRLLAHYATIEGLDATEATA